MNITVANFRKGPFGTALGFFDLTLDNVFVVKGFALKQKKDGTSYYYQAPSKARTDKAGNPVNNKEGFQIYDSYFDLYGERTDDGYKPTPEAWDGREAILKQAVALYDGAAPKGAGRGSAAKPKATATAATAGTVESTEDADTDDLPF